MLKTPAGRDSCEAHCCLPPICRSVSLPWLSLIYGNEGFRGDFLAGFKGRSRVIRPTVGESDLPPGRAPCLGSALLAAGAFPAFLRLALSRPLGLHVGAFPGLPFLDFSPVRYDSPPASV